MQIICKLHCLCICRSTPPYLYYIAWMLPQSANWPTEDRPTAKGDWPTSDNAKRYWARPRVDVLARSCCIGRKNQVGFEQMLKLLMNLLIFWMVNIFSWRGYSMIILPPNEQNSSLVRTYSILEALSRPLNVFVF